MNFRKYQILETVRYSSSVNPVMRSDYYQDSSRIIKCRQHIDELIQCNCLAEEPGTGRLRLTQEGLIAVESMESRIFDFGCYCFTTAIAVLALIVSFIALGH